MCEIKCFVSTILDIKFNDYFSFLFTSVACPGFIPRKPVSIALVLVTAFHTRDVFWAESKILLTQAILCSY